MKGEPKGFLWGAENVLCPVCDGIITVKIYVDALTTYTYIPHTYSQNLPQRNCNFITYKLKHNNVCFKL